MRAFRGVRPEALGEHYDVVLIGGGIGGLTCANLLARAGRSVLLMEQHYMIGGYCSTFRRKGYTFDAASHFYPLLGNRSTLTGGLLEEIGSRTEWVKMDPVDRFHLPDGTTFEVPADFDEYRRRLAREFPQEQEALERFFGIVHECYVLGVARYFRGRTSRWIEKYLPLTLGQVLDEHFESPRLKLILSADCPHWGAPPSRVSFVFDSMLRVSYFLGNYYPVGGSQAFADDLAARFEEQGGDVSMSTRATAIEVREGRVSGVRALCGLPGKERPVRITTSTVVSNADSLETIARLLPEGTAAPELLDGLRALKPSYPCFLTHIGLAGIPTEVLASIHGYYWDDWNSDDCGRGALRFKIFVPTLFEPGMAPEGKHVMILQRVQDLEYESIEDWPAHKRAVERRLLDGLERVLPNVRDHIEVCLSASALTSARFTRNLHGAMLGWEMSPEQLDAPELDDASLVAGLHHVGHWTRPGGGITPVMVSAQLAAKRVLDDEGRRRVEHS